MENLEVHEEEDVLDAFQNVISHLRDESDEKNITALALLNKGLLAEASKLADDGIYIQTVLTCISSYLSSKYRQVVSIH